MLGRQALTFTTGPIARVGPNTLVTSSPDLVMRMSAARSLYPKADWYAGSRIPPGQDNIFSQQDEEKHARRRAQMADGVRNKYVSSSVHFTYRS
jgi:cytochrome P450